MVIGQHGSVRSSASRARIMNFTNGPPGLSFPRRLLATSSRMTSRPSSHPPKWRLWHPSNGILFQPQPPYPALDAARIHTEASIAREATLDTIESNNGLRSDLKVVQEDDRSVTLEVSRSQTIKTTSNTVSTEWGRDIDANFIVEEERNSSEARQEELQAEPYRTLQALTASAPFTPLEYKMSDETFRAAKQAEANTDGSYWSYTLYRGPNEDDDIKGKVRVHYCKSALTAEKALQYFVGEKLLGLDLEWYPWARKTTNFRHNVRNNVSLVQIACESRILLLHLALYPGKDEFVTPTLKAILEDPTVTKSGVWIKGDCTRIKNFLGVEVRGQFELSHLYKQIKYSVSGQPELIDKRLVSLATQVEDIMGLPLKKDQDVRASNWSRPLNMAQIVYSASDAYVGVQLFATMNHLREKLDPCPALPSHSEMDEPIPIPPDLLLKLKAPANGDNAGGKQLEASAEAEHEGEGDEAMPPATRSGVAKAAETKARPSRATTSAKNGSDGGEELPELAQDPRFLAAEAWLKDYRAGRKIRVTPAALKAYHMWYNDENLNCASLAKILRNPPLQSSSVASYIVSSVMLEKLPYDKDRLRTDISPYISDGLLQLRFKPIWEAFRS